MKAWNRIMGFALLGVVIAMVLINIFFNRMQEERIPNTALVDINRAYLQLEAGKDPNAIALDAIRFDIVTQDELNILSYMKDAKHRIVVLPAKEAGSYYRFIYEIKRIPSVMIWVVNAVFLVVIVLFLYILYFIKHQIIMPFTKMEDMAQALKNRDFTYELPQQKYRFFGKFVWAVDVMKEELHTHEKKELSLMREKQTMISSLSHDIKTPLSNIRLYTDAMNMELYHTREIQERIYENCEKIDQYVKDIMNTSSTELFDFTVHKQDVYIEEIIKILKREKERITMAKVNCLIEEWKNVMICGDPARLREVIGNVIDNALKYGDGSWIHMSFYEEDHHVILQIENSGENIATQDINAIFNSFYRGQNVQEKLGNGLGLYICRQLMRKMDGDIFMSQKKGSVSFHIVFGIV